MIRSYLNSKQILFLVTPFVLVFYVYTNAQVFHGLIDEGKSFFVNSFEFENYNQITKEGIDKGYYKQLDQIQKNYLDYQRNFFEIDKEKISWILAYVYKNNIPKLQNSTNQVTIGGNIGKLQQLQNQIDQRNDSIGSLSLTQKAMDDDVAYIMQLVQLRLGDLQANNQKKLQIQNDKIDTKQYNLQLLFLGNNKEAIINNKLYKIKDEISQGVYIEKIESSRVLIKSQKDSQWLYLQGDTIKRDMEK